MNGLPPSAIPLSPLFKITPKMASPSASCPFIFQHVPYKLIKLDFKYLSLTLFLHRTEKLPTSHFPPSLLPFCEKVWRLLFI